MCAPISPPLPPATPPTAAQCWAHLLVTLPQHLANVRLHLNPPLIRGAIGAARLQMCPPAGQARAGPGVHRYARTHAAASVIAHLLSFFFFKKRKTKTIGPVEDGNRRSRCGRSRGAAFHSAHNKQAGPGSTVPGVHL